MCTVAGNWILGRFHFVFVACGAVGHLDWQRDRHQGLPVHLLLLLLLEPVWPQLHHIPGRW